MLKEMFGLDASPCFHRRETTGPTGDKRFVASWLDIHDYQRSRVLYLKRKATTWPSGWEITMVRACRDCITPVARKLRQATLTKLAPLDTNKLAVRLNRSASSFIHLVTN